MEAGWYSLVFSVSFRDLDFDSLESITFDAKLGDEGKCNLKDTWVLTVVGKEELKQLPEGGPKLLRLHRQANVSDGSKYLVPRITIQAAAGIVTPLSFELHHIELTTNSIELSSAPEEPVYTLYGDDKPHQFIKVGDSSKHPVKICAYAISDMGNYVATLHLVDDTAFLDIWDIQKQVYNSQPGGPQFLTAPYARKSFQLGDGRETADLTYEVAISSTGLQAAVCSLHEQGKASLPFSIHNCLEVTPADHSLGSPWGLDKLLISRTRFKGAFGNIAFRAIDSIVDSDDMGTKDERFFKFDGTTFDVYKASGYWSRLLDSDQYFMARKVCDGGNAFLWHPRTALRLYWHPRFCRYLGF
ncbi:hypothetical protein BGZ70_004343 [Mortierella alpina]|uniref:Uncharacterized protein n=1 Tax=Mortierella alpina TaxID=64518 RepID=A0A9P6M4X5_MORAP|nr:hypothetical protein BGZ70_004343 [Mortierella alpina]